jgi:hypothetical protein
LAPRETRPRCVTYASAQRNTLGVLIFASGLLN